MLRGSVERVVIIGLSMGGVLALLSCTRLNAAGVISISTPYSLPPDPRLKFVKLWSLVHPFRRKNNLPPGAGWFDKQAFRNHVSYSMNPVRSIGELDTLLSEMRLVLPQVEIPVLLIHSRDDSYVLPENLEQVYAALGTRDKEKLLVTGSGHVATEDAARGEIFEAALKFIRRIEGQS
jgi:carboxylesterase